MSYFKANLSPIPDSFVISDAITISGNEFFE